MRSTDRPSRHPALGKRIVELFDETPDIGLFIKDTARRFVWMNQPLARLLGYGGEFGARSACAMRTSHPQYVTAHYRRDDEDILRNGKRLIDAVELVRGERGNYDWFLSTKLPVR